MPLKILMPARLLCKVVDISAYIFEQEDQAKSMKKKASNWKRRLLKVHKALKRAYKEVDHYLLKCTDCILEKTTLKAAFTEEQEKL